ncbi:TonB-dependent receptor [Sphingomonadaceae bacterium LXI357]|uniref:TonB-dependent receptor n=2 Tax=Stakelama marina TaxID=2826939 RepID=A0A8T4IG68_9SPHN|nr:TonB-dependent receptor [Stakelama marina]
MALGAILLLTVSPAALAQSNGQNDTGAAENTAASDTDIVVTAQKLEQRAVDVPISITAVTGDRMDQLGVSDLDELSNYVPGLNIQEQSANNPGIVIRGITSDSGSAQQAARVTLYYNGVDISRSRGSYQDLYDIDRVEVIKGPQATLFGTASAVGAISIISKRPEPGFSGSLTIGDGNYDYRLLRGFVNAGSDVVAGRFAFAYKKRDGYVKNLAPNQGDLYAQDQLGMRGSLRLTPSDALTVDLIGTYDRQRNSGTPFISGSLPTTAGPAAPLSNVAWLGGSPYSESVLGSANLGLHRDVYDANLTARWDLSDDWTLTLVNGYRRFLSNEVFDADGSRAWYLEFAEDAKGWQASQETRFAYTSDRFRGSFGLNVFHEQGFQRVPFSTEEGTYLQCTLNIIPGLGCVAPDGTVSAAQATALATGGAATAIPYSSVFQNDGKNDSYSVFADGTWIPTPRLELTAGVRALIEQRISGYSATQPNAVLAGVPLLPIVDTAGQTFHARRSYQAFLPRFNALYHLNDDINVYATISKGRRSPTVKLNSARGVAGPVANVQDIPEETVWNYEAGLKGKAGIVSGSLAVYYETYSAFQVTVIDNAGAARTESAGSAKNLGVEAELFVRPTRWINLFGNIGYIGGGIDNNPKFGAYAGDQFRLQPKVQASGGFTFDMPMGDGASIFATPSITYRSKIYFELPNTELISQDPVTLVNIRGGVRFADGRYEAAAFARNLTNRHYLLDAGNTGGGFGYPTFIPAEPRFYGVELTANF